MKLSLFITLIMVLISGCKTQEDIRREKNLEVLNEQVTQTQKSSANNQSRFDNLEREVAKLSGNIEEFAHNRGNEQKDVLLLKDRIKTLEETIEKQNSTLVELTTKFNEQTKYIEEVHAALKDLSGPDKKKVSGGKEKEKLSQNEDEVDAKNESIQTVIALIRAKNYEEGRNMLQNMLENKKLKKKEKQQAIFYLGQIEFRTKNYDEAKVYFSKLYTEYPDSTLNSMALLNLAKSFLQLKSKEEAKQTLEELMEKYPSSKEASEAKTLKAKI